MARLSEAQRRHDWFRFRPGWPVSCRKCGIVQRADGKNSPCKGVVRVELRNPVAIIKNADEQPLSETDPVVGHKTFADGHHEPLRRSEADAIWAAVEAAKARRETAMPDTVAALQTTADAFQRLRDLGWREGIYCPKDGASFALIQWGSTGIHRGHYMGEWPTGHVYCGDFLNSPEAMMFKPLDALTESERAALAASDEDSRQFMERQVRMFADV